MNQLVRFIPTRWKHWDNSILFVNDISNAAPIHLPEAYTWTWANQEDIEFIDRHPEATSPTAYKTRFERGDRCLCLKRNKEIVGYNWITYKRCCNLCGFGPRMELTFLDMSPEQVFSYDLFIYREYRGRRIAILLIALMFQLLKSEGIKKIMSLVSSDNKPALRTHSRLGARPIRMAYAYRIRGWYRIFYGPERDPRLAQWLEQYRPVKRLTRHRPGNRGTNR